MTLYHIETLKIQVDALKDALERNPHQKEYYEKLLSDKEEEYAKAQKEPLEEFGMY